MLNFPSTTKHYKPDDKWPPRTAIQPIMFLSRFLADAERNYWPTELEIAGFVWVVKKTDHSAIVDIVKQRSIVSTTSTMQMNLSLVRASQFLCQFNLDVRYKPGKENIAPDALSRLASTNTGKLTKECVKICHA